ncbi:MAG: hypothetical protein J7621_03045 [Niastella sp.]|nr:hypothetical protein [Niastella sp.]
MKKLTSLFLVAIACSCNNAEKNAKDETQEPPAAATAATAMNYPYTIKNPDNWEIGSPANTMNVLKCLKAWEEGKVDESLQYFGDSVTVKFDGIDKTMSNDSLKAFFSAGRNSYKTVVVKMEDWESVVSKDKSEEWVTLWYTQTWETLKGVKDSVAVINDLKMKDGKIIRIDEYNRKLH